MRAVTPMRRKPTRMHMHIPRMPMPMPTPIIPRMITTMVITITMTNIATTIITTTITPMLMTTSEPVPADAQSGMTADEAAALYRLMTWLSPSFPVGAFSYSSGIEWAVEAGDITDAASLRDWLAAMLTDGSGFCDAVFLAQAHRAASARDDAWLARDRRACGSLRALARAPARDDDAGPRLYRDRPIRVGLRRARRHRRCLRWRDRLSRRGRDRQRGACVPLAPAMHAFLHALVSNWISAGARLVPLGQTDSQRILASLEADVAATAKRALASSLDDLGSATFRADLASLRHETQYTRLFRS